MIESPDKYNKVIVICSCIITFCLIGLLFADNNFLKNARNNFASVILSHNFKTVAQVKSRYNAHIQNDKERPVRILIVPGHEPDFGGTEYATLKERDLTVELADNLRDLLSKNSHYEVFVTRDSEGWTENFSKYFADLSLISEWRDAYVNDFSRLISIGQVEKTFATVKHNKAPTNVALRLYGINKWANDNDIDVVLHIHFNDNPRTNVSKPGKYSGVSMYIPAEQYGNSDVTKAIAEKVFNQITTYTNASNLPIEADGIIEEPDLIAVGAHNTSDAASLLIEYGYIYEPQFQNPETRSVAMRDLALQTYLGLQDFFRE
jgi:N-acetylmuramoyl-L-alanine amidase